jgi:hypothetical protein
MRLFRYLGSCLICLALVSDLQATNASDPLLLIPDQADFCVKIEQPRGLVEALTDNSVIKQLLTLEAVREAYSSTNLRRLNQLIAYFEKELGLGRLEIIDRLAGEGIALGTKLGPKPMPLLLVIQGKDEQLLRRFSKLGLEVVEQELARRESKDRPQKGKHRGIETIHIGKGFHAAVAGSALVISNVEKALQMSLDLYVDKGKKNLANVENVADARKLADTGALAWMWLNLNNLHTASETKELFRLPRNDAAQTVLVGGLLDVAGRSPFVCGSLHRQEQGFAVRLRMPNGREGMPSELAAHVPPAGQPGSRPLLEPRGVMLSSSYYLDVSKFWEQRAKLFPEKQLKTLEEFDKNSQQFLAGNRFSKLLGLAGAYQRIVVAHQPTRAYQTAPAQAIPAFAAIIETRQPEEFSKKMEAILRATALLATTQVKLKLVEEKYKDFQIISYRFREDAKFKPDTGNLRFNFSPAFVTVGNQFVVSSTSELCHELVDLLAKESKESAGKGVACTVKTQLYGSGGSEFVAAFKDRLFTTAILDQAIPTESAEEQVGQFIALIQRLGVLRIEAAYGARDFCYELRLELKP